MNDTTDERPPALFLLGPTASGKTGLAVSLAEQLSCGIISVDSALVYRGMDIGTAKPDASVLARAPHRLIDLLDPSERYSAARFRADALREMAALRREGRIPLLVGGTGLYFRALERGLSPLPPADGALRARLQREAEEQGWEAMHRRLAEVDPAAAARIHPHDPQRLQRALEVFALTGRPLSQQQRATRPLPYRVVKLIVAPASRERLRERIAERFQQMLAEGLVEEVERLYRRGDLSPDLPAMRCVGYRQVWGYLDGAYGYEEMVTRAITATRQLAKRQMTWLRREEGLRWFESEEAQLPEKVLKFLSQAAIK